MPRLKLGVVDQSPVRNGGSAEDAVRQRLELARRWQAAERMIPAGSYLVPMEQPLAVVAMYLLEPESDDGFATWSAPAEDANPGRPKFAAPLRAGGEFPVLRVLEPGR
ncbi:hypothetical protein BH23GEM3_BH23GEM3_26160 [soil metagenome]